MNRIGLKNFRIFNNYQEFELKPITVLTGPNNSGKSTFSKLFKLLSEGFRTRNNIKEIDVLYFTDKLRQEIGNFKSNISRFSDDDYIEISLSNWVVSPRKPDLSPNFESTIFLKYYKVTADTFESKIARRAINPTTIQDKNIEAYLQSIRIVINEHEIIELTRKEGDEVCDAEFLNAVETYSVTDELIWRCDLDKKYANSLRDIAVKIKNTEICEVSRVQKDPKLINTLARYLVTEKIFYKFFNTNKELLFPSLLSGIVLGLDSFFSSDSLAEDYFINIRKILNSNQINNIENFISTYRDFEEKFIHEVFIIYFSKFHIEWVGQAEENWMEIDNLNKILGKEIRKKSVKIDEIKIINRISNPLTKLFIEEFLLKDKPEYVDLLSKVSDAKEISFLNPTIEAINSCIKMPYIETVRELKEQKAERYQQNNLQQNYFFKDDISMSDSMVYHFAEHFVKGLISKEANAFLNKWLKRLGVGDELIIESIKVGNEVIGYSFVVKKDGLNYPMSENGLGIQKVIKILLELSMHELSKYPKEMGRIVYNYKGRHGTILLEEPESNLHPAFQSLLVEILADAIITFSLSIIIETHSEYFIRKLQYLTAQKEIKPDASIIYYFHHPDIIPNGEEQVKKIKINEDGSLTDDFGPGFFDEATNIKFDLLRLKNTKNN